MHEASLMRDLMRRLDSVAKAEGADRITAVHVWLGALSHMSKAHFLEHFEAAAPGTVAEGATVTAMVSDDPHHPDAQGVILQDVEVERRE